jgi:hypothetical protein
MLFVNDLVGSGTRLFCQVPDPCGPVAQHNDMLRPREAVVASQCIQPRRTLLRWSASGSSIHAGHRMIGNDSGNQV